MYCDTPPGGFLRLNTISTQRCHMYCDSVKSLQKAPQRDFNSRCHMYCDIGVKAKQEHPKISTHAVTCTVTSTKGLFRPTVEISTHAVTCTVTAIIYNFSTFYFFYLCFLLSYRIINLFFLLYFILFVSLIVFGANLSEFFCSLSIRTVCILLINFHFYRIRNLLFSQPCIEGTFLKISVHFYRIYKL